MEMFLSISDISVTACAVCERGLKVFICVPVEVGEFSIIRFVAARCLPQTRKPYGFA